MYKILIVDDEIIVRQALKALIQWEDGIYELAGTAANGKAALEFIQTTRPDIIITDIKMPEMSGIALIRELKSVNYDGEILVLSNFNDFELVREALKFGAHDYVLKLTVKSEDFMRLLGEISEKLRNKRNQTTDSSSASAAVAMERTRDMLRSIVYSSVSLPSGIAPHVGDSLLETVHDGERLCVHLVKMYRDDPFEMKSDIAELCKHITGEVLARSKWNFVFPMNDSTSIIIAAYSMPIHTNLPKELAQRFLSLCSLYYNTRAGIVHSGLITSIRMLKEELDACRKTADLLFYSNSNLLYGTSEINQLIHNDTSLQSLTEILQTNERLLGGQMEEWLAAINELVEISARSKLHPNMLKRAIRKMIWHVGKELLHHETAHSRLFDESEWIDYIDTSESEQELLSIVKRLAEEVTNKIGQSAIPNIHDVKKLEVRKAMIYIEKNYSDKISTVDIARHVNLSNPYFCHIFKMETGKKVMSYVTELRMRKANELLATGNYLVKEVAAMVGIDDPFYFNRLFKKYFGVSPVEIKGR